MNDIGLLLAYGDSNEPVLGDGLPAEAGARGAEPAKEDVTAEGFLDAAADPNDLVAQGWGLVVPDDDKVGDRLRALIDPLVQERKRQTGQEPRIYKVPRGMDAEASTKWWRDVYQDESVEEYERPRYLVILGDADLVSWEFQQRLSLATFIGRLTFPKEDDYAAYASKVLAWERRAPVDSARALFYTVRDGTTATRAGHSALMAPTVADAREAKGHGKFGAKELVWLDEETPDISADDFMRAAAQPTPTMMFSISHGSGAPRGDWASTEEKLRFQGQMCMLDKQKITHEDVANRPFLPGGLWFFFACLGAGTPGDSAYRHWLAELKEIGFFRGSIDEVMMSLPKPEKNERPFMSRLPQAALANPDGPLSIIGHVDLAWTFGFQEYAVKDGKTVAKDRPSRFEGIFRSLIEGKRMGAGYGALQTQLSVANTDLTVMYDNEARARSKGQVVEDDRARKMKKATLWMERQDLSAYVLLGDPAVRLSVDPARAHASVSAPMPIAANISSAPSAAPVPVPAPTAKPASTVKKLTVEAMERKILPILADETNAEKVAQKLEDLGIKVEDVKAWVTAYQNAGRKALEDL